MMADAAAAGAGDCGFAVATGGVGAQGTAAAAKSESAAHDDRRQHPEAEYAPGRPLPRQHLRVHRAWPGHALAHRAPIAPLVVR